MNFHNLWIAVKVIYWVLLLYGCGTRIVEAYQIGRAR
jgi:hypothetical protein